MSDFRWSNPVAVYLWPEQYKELSKSVAGYGNQCLFTYGGGSIKSTGFYDIVMDQFSEEGVTVFEKGKTEPNQKIQHIREAVAMCKENDSEVLLVVRGGNAIDAAKYIAAWACVDFDPWESIAKQIVPKKALSIVVVLTAEVTGSEKNSDGIISDPETNDKISKRRKTLYQQIRQTGTQRFAWDL